MKIKVNLQSEKLIVPSIIKVKTIREARLALTLIKTTGHVNGKKVVGTPVLC